MPGRKFDNKRLRKKHSKERWTPQYLDTSSEDEDTRRRKRLISMREPEDANTFRHDSTPLQTAPEPVRNPSLAQTNASQKKTKRSLIPRATRANPHKEPQHVSDAHIAAMFEPNPNILPRVTEPRASNGKPSEDTFTIAEAGQEQGQQEPDNIFAESNTLLPAEENPAPDEQSPTGTQKSPPAPGLVEFATRFLKVVTATNMSERAAQAMLQFFVKNQALLASVPPTRNGYFPGFRSLKKTALEDADIMVELGFLFIHKKSLAPKWLFDREKMEVPDSGFIPMYEFSRVKLLDLHWLHQRCRDRTGSEPASDRKQGIYFSIDGVVEAASTPNSMIVVSVRFEGCEGVFPLAIWRPICPKNAPKAIKDLRLAYRDILEKSICDRLGGLHLQEQFNVLAIIADSPVRADLLNLKQSGTYSCIYCEAEGSNIQVTVEIGEGKDAKYTVTHVIKYPEFAGKDMLVRNGHEKVLFPRDRSRTRTVLVWPKGRKRTHVSISEKGKVADSARRDGGKYGKDFHKEGVKGSTFLSAYRLPFSLPVHVPAEHMHCVFIGVWKRLFSMLFDFDQGDKNAKTGGGSFQDQLPSGALLDRFLEVSFLTEQPRRGRVCAKEFTAAEWKVLLLDQYQQVVDEIEAADLEEDIKLNLADVIYTLAFLSKAYQLCDDDLNNLRSYLKFDLEVLTQRWAIAYQELFGTYGMTSNVHLFTHMETIRQAGPLTETSAFRYEKSYSKLREVARKVKMSRSRHIMETVLLTQALHHTCKRRFRVATKGNFSVDDSLFYTRGVGGRPRYYIATEVDEESDDIIAEELVGSVEPARSVFEGFSLPMGETFHILASARPTGVTRTVAKSEIAGKMRRVMCKSGELFVAVPKDQLFDV